MAERMPLAEYGQEEAEQPLFEAPETKTAPITDIDIYRRRASRRSTFKRMGRTALKLPGAFDALSITPIDVSEYPNGDITIRYAEYRNGYPEDEFGVPHKGWQQEPQTERLITASFNAEDDTVTASELHSRNRRYVESDLRAKKHMAEHEDNLQEAKFQLDEARSELQKEIENLKAAEAEHRAAEVELHAAIARMQLAESGLLTAQKAVENY